MPTSEDCIGLGNKRLQAGNLDAAVRHFKEGYLEFKNLEDADRKYSIAIRIGTIKQSLKDFDSARTWYHEGLKIAETYNITSGICVALYNLSTISRHIGDTSASLDYASRVCSILKKPLTKFESSMMGSVLHLMASCFLKEKDLLSARTFLDRAIEISEDGSEPYMFHVQNALGILELGKKNYAAALQHFKNAGQIAIILCDTLKSSVAEAHIGNTKHLLQHVAGDSFEHYNKSLAFVQRGKENEIGVLIKLNLNTVALSKGKSPSYRLYNGKTHGSLGIIKNAAAIDYVNGQYDQSISKLINGLKCNSMGDVDDQVACNVLLGANKLSLGMPVVAINYLEKSLEMAKDYLQLETVRILEMVGESYLELKNHESAFEYFNQQQMLSGRLNKSSWQIKAQWNVGLVHQYRQNFYESSRVYKDLVSAGILEEDYRLIARVYEALSSQASSELRLISYSDSMHRKVMILKKSKDTLSEKYKFASEEYAMRSERKKSRNTGTKIITA